jgi:peptidyl-prolyl cis-trans isomerase SurA
MNTLSNKMRKAGIMGLIMGLVASGAVHAAPEQSLDKIAVIINNDIVTQSELNAAIATAKRQMVVTHTPIPPAAELQKKVLDHLIERKLQLELATNAGIHIGEDEVTLAISHIAHENNVSVAELYHKVAGQGLTMAEYRREIHEEILLQIVEQQEVGAKIRVTPAEVNDYLSSHNKPTNNSKEYHLQDMLFALPEAPTAAQIAAATKQAKDVLAKLHSGAKWQSISKSSDDLGWRKMREIPTAFTSHLKAQNKTYVGPIQTANGIHIIRIVSTREVAQGDNHNLTAKDAEQLVFQSKFAAAIQVWLRKLRSEAFINTHPN